MANSVCKAPGTQVLSGKLGMAGGQARAGMPAPGLKPNVGKQMRPLAVKKPLTGK